MSGTSCCGVQAGSCFCSMSASDMLAARKASDEYAAKLRRKMIGYCVCGCGVMVYEDDDED